MWPRNSDLKVLTDLNPDIAFEDLNEDQKGVGEPYGGCKVAKILAFPDGGVVNIFHSIEDASDAKILHLYSSQYIPRHKTKQEGSNIPPAIRPRLYGVINTEKKEVQNQNSAQNGLFSYFRVGKEDQPKGRCW